MLIITFKDQKTHVEYPFEYPQWDHSDIYSTEVQKEVEKLAEKFPNYSAFYAGAKDPEFKETVVKEFDGGYGRRGVVSIMNKGISSITNNKGPVVSIDASEGEYSSIELTEADLRNLIIKLQKLNETKTP